MKYKIFAQTVMGAVLMTGMASCTSDNDSSNVIPDEKGMISLEIRSGINGGGRTALSGTDVVFQNGDKLAVWDGVDDKVVRPFSTDEDGSVVKFTGEIKASATNLNILYPLESAVSCSDDGIITATIPTEQTATENTFDPKANLSVATATYTKGQNVTCTLENVCGVLKFTISDDAAEEYYDYIQLIGIANKDLTDLAGTVKISALEQKITGMTAGEKMITLTKKDDDNKLQKGKTYCIVMNPQASIDSLRMKFFKGNEEAGMATITKADKSQFSISSGVILNAGTITPKTVSGFTINNIWDRVVFAKGNLYYDKTPDDGKYWKFEANQYDYRTYSGYNSTPADTYGLFGWGDVPANGANIKTSQNNADYQWTEWGTKIGDGKTWRTLTQAEWAYLIQSRNGASSTEYFGKTCQYVTFTGFGANIDGLLLYPDDYPDAQKITGSITEIPADCVFLPCAGNRFGSTSVIGVGSNGDYWSGVASNDNAYDLGFYNGHVNPANFGGRYIGRSVRLVCPAE